MFRFFSLAIIIFSISQASMVSAQNSNTSCTVESKNFNNIPVVLPSIGYISPNNTNMEIMGNDRSGQLHSLSSAAMANAVDGFSAAAQIRGTLRTWDEQHVKAAKKFWNAYDTTGVVNKELAKEYAFWLHKRQVYDSYARNRGKEFFAIFKGRPGSFETPYYLSLDINSSSRKYLSSAKYKEHFYLLYRYDYRMYSRCSPAAYADTDSFNWIINHYMHYEPRASKERLARMTSIVTDWKNKGGDLEALKAKLQQKQQQKGYNVSNEIDEFINGLVSDAAQQRLYVTLNRAAYKYAPQTKNRFLGWHDGTIQSGIVDIQQAAQQAGIYDSGNGYKNIPVYECYESIVGRVAYYLVKLDPSTVQSLVQKHQGYTPAIYPDFFTGNFAQDTSNMTLALCLGIDRKHKLFQTFLELANFNISEKGKSEADTYFSKHVREKMQKALGREDYYKQQ